MKTQRLPQSFFRRDARVVAPDLLNKILLAADGRSGRIVEVEAYCGAIDPAAHTYRGKTRRNAVMFGPPGVLYVYFSYGMHTCVNVTTGPDGIASAVLIRAGEIIAGQDEARARRPAARTDAALAKGPGNVGSALGISLSDYGIHLFDPKSPIRLELGPEITDPTAISAGPRVGVSLAADRPWRLWLTDSPAVSAYRRSPRAPHPA